MTELREIKDLAIQYFEGKISPENETNLFEYIKQNSDNRSLFKSWEKEWMLSGKEEPYINKEWEHLYRKIVVQEAVKPTFAIRKTNLWSRIATVAAVMALLVSVSLFATYLLSNATVNYATVETPKGEKSKVTLSDGTVVWLNSGSKLTYADNYRGSKFKVKLEGEGYFEVAKQKNKKFIVQTDVYDIEVKGTKFNVMAYKDEKVITTTLLEGKIDLLHNNKRVEIAPGEEVKYNVQTGTLSKSIAEDASAASIWTQNRFLYENITLRELASKLSRQYGVNIRIEAPQFAEKRLNLSLRNDETVNDVMKAIEIIMQVKVEQDGFNYYIKEK